MQNEEHDASDTILESHCEDTSDKLQVNAKTARRLEKLAPLRITPALIKFQKDAPEFKGGYAIVSRALLVSPSDSSNGPVAESKGGNVGSNDGLINLEGGLRQREAGGSNGDADHVAKEGADEQEHESDGETSEWRKAVAVKKMNVKTPDEVSRVLSLTLREAELLANVSHRNVIQLEGFVEEISKGVIWLVFPWEDNGTLKDFVALHDWEVPERIGLIYDVTAGVEYLHTRTPPICHADLKSINILVNSECHAVITDFGSAHHPPTNGLSKEREGATMKRQPVPPVEATFCTTTNTITLTGIQCTTRWAAPEVLENDEFSLASDIWSLGWVAYEVMTNSIPFQDVKEPMVVHRVVRGDLPSISNDVRMLLIQELCSVVRLCWYTDPRKRPTAKDCRDSMSWMPMIAPSLGRTNDATGFVDRSAELLMQLGYMCRRQSDFANASKNYAKALDLYTDITDRKGEADALVQLAEIHQYQQRYTEATTLYTKALEIYTDVGNNHGRASALWGLAEAHRLRDEYNQAVTFFSECLEIRTDSGNKKGRAECLLCLAGVHRARNEYSQAVTLYSECMQILTDIGDRQGRAEALWGLADLHRLQKDKYWRAYTLRNMAHAHRDQGHHSTAIHHYEQAAELFKELGNTAEESFALMKADGLRRSLEQQGAT